MRYVPVARLVAGTEGSPDFTDSVRGVDRSDDTTSFAVKDEDVIRGQMAPMVPTKQEWTQLLELVTRLAS